MIRTGCALNRWEYSGNELWAMNVKRLNLVTQADESHRRGVNQV